MIEFARTEHGMIAGEVFADGVAAFRGVPYAAAPKGPLRWRKPQPPARWAGTRPCRCFGPISIQPLALPASPLPFYPEAQDEDCLHLNIWTAAEAPGEQRPVIIWFHPGGYQFESGSAALFDGSNWARAGAVLVTFNHRLGLLGFLAHPALSDEQGAEAGNYGLFDQIAVLCWVRANIAQFGGDPACVTLFGLSSGASSISLLMASPHADGLFHRVIAESGGSFGPMSDTTGIGDCWQTRESAERSGAAWANALGVTTLEALRELPADSIRASTGLARDPRSGIFDGRRPFIGGHGLVASTSDRFRTGLQAQVPVLAGYAAREELFLGKADAAASYRERAESEFGTRSERFLRFYPAADAQEAARSETRATGHRLFTWQAWAMAMLHARSGHPVYLYRFEQAPPSTGDAGAFHGASIFYLFDRFGLRPDFAWRQEDHALSASMIDAWMAFARTGAPQSRLLPHWPRFDPQAPRAMRLREDSVVDQVCEQAALNFWSEFYWLEPSSADALTRYQPRAFACN